MKPRVKGNPALWGMAAMVLAAGSACRKTDREAKPAPDSGPKSESAAPAIKAAPPPDSSGGRVFRSRSGPAGLRVEWREIDSLTAKATLVAANDSARCEKRITGVFRSEHGADAEVLVNEDGDGIPATQYTWKSGNCWIGIQIAEEAMKVSSADCQAEETDGCRFDSEDLLALEKTRP